MSVAPEIYVVGDKTVAFERISWAFVQKHRADIDAFVLDAFGPRRANLMNLDCGGAVATLKLHHQYGQAGHVLIVPADEKSAKLTAGTD